MVGLSAGQEERTWTSGGQSPKMKGRLTFDLAKMLLFQERWVCECACRDDVPRELIANIRSAETVPSGVSDELGVQLASSHHTLRRHTLCLVFRTPLSQPRPIPARSHSQTQCVSSSTPRSQSPELDHHDSCGVSRLGPISDSAMICIRCAGEPHPSKIVQPNGQVACIGEPIHNKESIVEEAPYVREV